MYICQHFESVHLRVYILQHFIILLCALSTIFVFVMVIVSILLLVSKPISLVQFQTSLGTSLARLEKNVGSVSQETFEKNSHRKLFKKRRCSQRKLFVEFQKKLFSQETGRSASAW